MHFGCLLITEEFPTDKVIADKLAPYNEEKYYDKMEKDEPIDAPFLWDWYCLGGRWCGMLKIDVRRTTDKYKWYFYDNKRSGRLFRSELLENWAKMNKSSLLHIEENCYGYMGMNDGFLYVDGGAIDDMMYIDVDKFYILLDKDGEVYISEDNPDFQKQVTKAIKNAKGCYISVIDLHD